MCGIFFSTNKDKFIELKILNQSRGKFAYSYFGINENLDYKFWKNFGVFDERYVDDRNIIHIGHCQAPTGGLIQDEGRIHPAKLKGNYLFHNGIINTFRSEEWDTMFFLKLLNDDFKKTLNEIEGSFSCIFITNDKNIVFFRNSLCPLFYFSNYDDGFHLSSVSFKNSKPLPYGKVFQYIHEDYQNECLEKVFEFNSNKVYDLKG